MKNRRLCLIAAAITVLAAREARGDIYHMVRPSKLITEKGAELRLPPGYFLDEPTWNERDAELRGLQEIKIRREAENKSLRESVNAFPWVTIGVSGALGIAAGVLIVSLVK